MGRLKRLKKSSTSFNVVVESMVEKACIIQAQHDLAKKT